LVNVFPVERLPTVRKKDPYNSLLTKEWQRPLCLSYDFLQKSQDIAERFRHLLGNNLKYSSKAPDQNIWGGDGDDSLLNLETESGDENTEVPDFEMPGWWRGFIRKPKTAIGATIKAFFYPEHDPDGLLGSPGDWYRGKIVSQNIKDDSWNVLFEDGDKGTYPNRDFKYNLDVRVLSSPEYKIVFVGNGQHDEGYQDGQTSLAGRGGPGPWEIWLKTNLSDLLLSIFRASRRNHQHDNHHVREIIACPSFK